MGLIVKLGGTEYKNIVKGTLVLTYGHISSSFELSVVFDPEDDAQRKLMKPLSYQDITIWTDLGKKVITGTVLNFTSVVKKEEEVSTIIGYSKTGVLMDCEIPVSLYPLEFNGLSLKDIAEKILEPFNIKVIIDNDGGAATEVIPEITADTTQKISKFLREVASQKNLIISHDGDGNLVFTRTRTNVASIATYRESIPAVKIALEVNGENMHSSITAMKQADLFTDNAAEQSIDNALVPAFRPSTKNQSVGTDNATLDVARNARANELRNIQLSIESDRWTWLNADEGNKEDLVQPNNIIDVISPNNYIPDRTQFFVEKVILKTDAKKEIATIACVLPEVYNNEDPKIRFK